MNQNWNAKQYISHASFVAEYGLPVLELLDPKQGEKILDLGCGDGKLTKKIEQSGAKVLGVDSSLSMIKTARKRDLSVEVMNGECLGFINEFQAVFSNAALHWMTNSDAVISGVYNALKPAGRFVGELGGEGNVDALVSAMSNVFQKYPEFGEFKNPWYFPSVNEYQKQLQSGGFKVQYIEMLSRSTPLGAGLREWLKIFSNGITTDLSENQKDIFYTEVEKLVKPRLFVDGQWLIDYVRLRFSAQKI